MLDSKRLGKQRIEVLQILRVLAGESRGWQNHPAVRMWRGYEEALAHYGLEVCGEWTRRGYIDNTSVKIREISKRLEDGSTPCNPPWLGNRSFHRSHQSNLVRKNAVYYRRYFPDVRDDLPYVWPV